MEWCLAQDRHRAPRTSIYIAYDHLHTQDLRRWLGTDDKPGYFPRAKLLVMRQEWESAHGLLPPQHESGTARTASTASIRRKIVLLDGDVRIGESVAILRTPGHTEGNQSFVVRTPRG